MGRWVRARPGRRPATSEVIESLYAEIDAARDIEDEARLRDLLKFGQGIAAWVAQFDVNSPATLLAAGAVGHLGIARFMEFIDAELGRLAPLVPSSCMPQSHGKNKKVTEWQEAKQRLSETLNYFQFLREAVAGSFRVEPEIAYPCNQSLDRVTWTEVWEPGGEEASLLAELRFPGVRKHAFMRRRLDKAQRNHNQIVKAGGDRARALIADMSGDQRDVGFAEIRERIAALPLDANRSRLTRTLNLCERRTRALLELVPEAIPGDPTPYGKPFQEFFAASVIDRFIKAGRVYAEECLPLLGLPRGSLQDRRKRLLRRFAIVAQYAFLASGNGLFGRFAEVVAAIDVFSQHLQSDVKALLDAVSAKSQANKREVQEMVRDLNRLIIEPKVLKRWRAAPDEKAKDRDSIYYGRFIAEIVKSVQGQSGAWDRKDVAPALARARLITAKGKAGRGQVQAVTDACVVMQRVGLAVQLPFNRLVGNGKPSSRAQLHELTPMDGENTPWIVNPLGAVLAVERQTTAGRQRRSRHGKSRHRRAGSQETAGPRGVVPGSTNQKRGVKPGVVKPKAPRKRLRPKVAKKKTRA